MLRPRRAATIVWPLALALLAAGACGPRPRTTTPVAPVEAARPSLPSRFDADAVATWFDAQATARGLVGAQLGVMRDGEVVLVRSHGTAVRGGAPVTPQTAFAIGSITKQFVCAAAVLLQQQGRLSLADPVAKYYPELTRADEITLDDLGAHLSGYPDYYPLDFLDSRMRAAIDPDALLQRYAGAPLQFEPRSRWSYSNTGYILLGRVIERVTGVPLGAWLREHVFGRVGMTGASLDPAPGTAGLAAGHGRFALGEPEPVPREAAGWIHAAGGIYTTATELLRWDLALADRSLLGADTDRLTTPRTLRDGRSTDYGCGLGVRHQAGEVVWSHSGAVSGFVAFNAIVPRTRTAVVLLSNTETPAASELHQELLALVIAPPDAVPTVAGPPATEVAGALFEQLQRGALDRRALAPELAGYYDDARVRAAAPRLRALGTVLRVEADRPRERGGLEVTSVRLVLAARVIKAVLVRRPDGIVEQFLLLE
ncbi:MAG: beta-lactamase family protein [Nannocystaceae bacterium]|nr:beta-lactamase family protein [Nannocystaceae bacterium]